MIEATVASTAARMTCTESPLLSAALRDGERRKVIAELEGLLFTLKRPHHEIPGLYRAVELVRAMIND